MINPSSYLRSILAYSSKIPIHPNHILRATFSYILDMMHVVQFSSKLSVSQNQKMFLEGNPSKNLYSNIDHCYWEVLGQFLP